MLQELIKAYEKKEKSKDSKAVAKSPQGKKTKEEKIIHFRFNDFKRSAVNIFRDIKIISAFLSVGVCDQPTIFRLDVSILSGLACFGPVTALDYSDGPGRCNTRYENGFSETPGDASTRMI